MTNPFDMLVGNKMASGAERMAIHTIAKSLAPDATIVEIGVWKARTTMLLRNAVSKNCRCYAIDPYPQNGIPELLNDNGVTFHKGTSKDFSASFDGAIDFLFIDGDHSFYWVLEDITTLSRFLKKDSIVAFHDYSIHNYGIKIVVEALKRHGALKNLLKLHSLALGIFNPEAGLPNLNTYIDVARDSIFTPLDYINRWERTTESWADNCASMLFSLPNLKDVKFIGRGLRGWLLQTLLGLPDDMFINSDQANNAEQTYIILSGMWKEISTSLILAKELPIYNVKALSNFAISKLMYQDMLGGRKKINRFARSQFELDFFDGLFGGMPEHELFHLHNNGTLLAFFEGMFPDRVVSPLDRFTDTNARP